MRSSEINELVRAFIGRYIRTFEELQVVCLARTRSELTLSELRETLALTSDQARTSATSLQARGLLVRLGAETFRLDTGAELVAAITEVGELYVADPAILLRLLNDNAVARVRTAAREIFQRPGEAEPKK